MSDDTPPSRADAPSDGLSSRRVAFGLLHKVLINNRPLDEALNGDSGNERSVGDEATIGGLSVRDRAFARLLVATTLRRLGQIDALIAHAVARPLPRQAAAVRDVLRLGICQLLFLHTPRHAAVSTSVNLAEAVKVRSYKGLVNAVLRRLADEGPALIAAQDAPRLNTPDWLWESWCQAFGPGTARSIATAHLAEAPLDITVKSDPDRWAALLSGVVLPTGSVRRASGGAVPELPGFAEGNWWVQDVAAAMPVALLGNVTGLRVLDMCAAPGGKTAQLAAAGAQVTAVDRSAKRLGIVRQNLDRLALSATLIASDAMLLSPPEPYDAVLLDAPCSATGTIRRHPDIAQIKTPADIAKLAAAQRPLLRRTVDLVRPGGLIVWCTCSLQPDEGEAQIDDLIATGAPVERLPITAAEIGGLEAAITPKGDVRTLPHFDPDGITPTDRSGSPPPPNGALGGVPSGMDGFHMARLRRR